MWQSRVEIKDYSVAYFDCIAAFEVPYCWTSIKGGAHTCFVDAWISNNSTNCIWALPLTEVHQYGTLNTAMWSKYVMESSSVSTWDCHKYVFICWHNLMWNQYQCRCHYVCMYTMYMCGVLKLCQCLLVHVDSYKPGFTTAKYVCPLLAPLASVWLAVG